MGSIRVLSIGAHPGDPLDECAATLAKHAKRGDIVTMVALTHGITLSGTFWGTWWGERSTSASIARQKRTETREAKRAKAEEFSRAAKILGVKSRIMGYDQPLVYETTIMMAVVDLIRELRPTIILTMNPHNFGHPDHSVAADIVSRACVYSMDGGIITKHPPYPELDVRKVYYSTNDVPDAYASPDYLVDVSDTADLRVDALYCLSSQYPNKGDRQWLERVHRDVLMGYLARGGENFGMKVNIKYAEAFKHAFKRLPVQYLPS